MNQLHLVCFISNAVLESTLDEPQMSMLVAYFTRKIHTLLLNIIDFKKLYLQWRWKLLETGWAKPLKCIFKDIVKLITSFS